LSVQIVRGECVMVVHMFTQRFSCGAGFQYDAVPYSFIKWQAVGVLV